MEVIPFQPDIIKQFPAVRDFTISVTGNEAYFTAQSPLGELSAIIQIRRENKRWSSPKIASFSGKYQDLEPFLTHDGLKLFFASNKPKSPSDTSSADYDIWYVQRESPNADWSDPINVGSPVNTTYNEFYPAVSNNHNLYFTSDPPTSKGKDDIYVSEWKDEAYQEPLSLSDSINSDGYEFNAFIAPDESFIIFSG